MVHHRRVAFGAGSSQPHQRTASGAVSGSAGLGLVDRSTTTGSEQATHNYTTTSFGSSHVEELRRNTPTAAQEGGGGRRHELPWKNRKSLLGIVALVLVAGVFVIFLTNEILTNTASSSGAGVTALTWREAVAGCTAAEDGFVYGGETGNVLTFVRRGSGEGGGGGRGGGSDRGHAEHNGGGSDSGAGVDRPALPDVLRWFWRVKHDRGVLAYEVAELEERRDVGVETGWEVIFASNVGRHKPFPAAGPAEVAWDPSSFNFYKASPAEFMLSYTPSFRYERESAATFTAASAAGKAGALGDGVDLAGRAATALRGAGGVRAAGSTGSDYFSSVGCKEASTASPPQDAVLVNIRPVGPVSLLLTPGYPHAHNQKAAAESLAVAMDFAEALRVDPGFRLGFNSAGSSASVNHLHFQCWYFDAGPGGLPIEASKTVHAATVPLRGSDAVEVHTLAGYPIRTLVFYTLGKDLEAVGEVIERCINYLVEENTPHTIVFSTGRAFLLPRQHLEEPPFAAVPGFPEVSGEVIVTKKEDFRIITADQIFDWWRDKISVSAEHFGRITGGCLK
ncbi:unnamed protein product [Pylaiella littoralis]